MSTKKGRNKELIELRNRKLIERYYYWTEVKRRRIDDVIEILKTKEFFIKEQSIMDILRDNNDYINEIINKNINPGQLNLFEQA